MPASISKKTNNRGFTLIETFVAITILMIAVLGPMSIIAKFYADSTFAKNQIASAFLAQDGMETVENIINNNTGARFSDESCVSKNFDWLVEFASCKEGTGNGCNVDSSDNTVMACDDAPDGHGCPLGKTTEGFYVLPTSETAASIFKRKITIEDISDGRSLDLADLSTYRREARVISRVWWVEKGKDVGPVTVSSLIIQFQCQ